MYKDDQAEQVTFEVVNTMIASELNTLTSAERKTVLEDVHGVTDLPPEENRPNMIRDKLVQMDVALRSIPVKPAFDEAQRLCAGQSGGLVNDLSFRLKFLRAEHYDTRKAALRMVGNLQIIGETFGPEGLVRPVYLSDMMLDRENQGSSPFLFSGNFFQVMPFRDRMGRRIIVRSGRRIFSDEKEVDIKTRVCSCMQGCGT